MIEKWKRWTLNNDVVKDKRINSLEKDKMAWNLFCEIKLCCLGG